MPYRVSFNLGDADLEHFAEVAQQTQAMARTRPADEIAATARQVLEKGSQDRSPEFIKERYSRLKSMLDMLDDADWQLPTDDCQRVLNALACFGTSETQSTPASTLDHAIMIELVSRDLEHDIASYREFTRFRDKGAAKHAAGSDAREQWLALRRSKLQSRMHERRARDLAHAGSAVAKLFALFRWG
jgi:hypothetical protein